MITIYHGSRPYLPLLACCRHLGLTGGIAGVEGWNWEVQPLRLIGVDRHGVAVCCLVHGRYQELYHKALNGVAAIFGLAVNLVDIEYLLCRQAQNSLLIRVGLPFARFFPRVCGRFVNRPVARLVETYLAIQQEGQHWL